MSARRGGLIDLARLWRAAGYSWSGLKAAGREPAFRQELVLFVVLAPLAIWLGDGAVERVLLVASLALVLIVELLNSAIEATVDRIGVERHALAARAKDLGSAAVLLAILVAIAVWAALLLPKL